MGRGDLGQLDCLSPLDGRYVESTRELREYFSETALIKYRIKVEVEYVLELVEFLKVEKVSQVEKSRLRNWVKKVVVKEVGEVKQIEKETKHDVKAVEYLIKDKLKDLKLTKLSNWVHWGLTSEDVNNLSLGLMMQAATDRVLMKNQVKLVKQLVTMGERYSNVVMTARTHGQIAVPTTMGKELTVFASRAVFFLEKIKEIKLGGKLNGAVGNFNAYIMIYPKKNWLKFSERFIKNLGLEPTRLTTQIEPAGRLVYVLDLWRQVNNIWRDLAGDIWQYIAFDYLNQKVNLKEVGSSTMPHKVNPIDFEKAEGNLEMADALLVAMSNKLSVSRMQRDLSDSTVKRNIGSAFGYGLVAVKSLIKGLEKVKPNKELLLRQVKQHPEMLAEAWQLWLKTKGEEHAFEKVKQRTRGKKADWRKILKGKNWRVEDYVGLAAKLTKKEIKKLLPRLRSLL